MNWWQQLLLGIALAAAVIWGVIEHDGVRAMNPRIIRFPTSANLLSMATPLPWWRLVLRRLFGHHRRTLNRNTIKFDRIRRGR